MARIEFLIVVAFAALACCTEVEDTDQKKRGAGKGNTLNSIPTGAQKQDYNTYSIYTQNPNSQSGSSNPSYQSQSSNSFYPNQANQYYTSNTPTDPSSGYVQHPQINILPQAQSQFVPINFVPNPGYQSKYQLVPSQHKGNIQLAILQQPSNYQTPPLYSTYPPNLFSPNPTSSIGPHHNYLNSLSSVGQFNVAPNLPLSLGSSYLGQPSTMVLLAQPNPSLYNNLLYNSPGQSLYNYFPSSSQPKYGLSYSQPGSTDFQVPLSQNVAKEENEISPHTSDYTAPSDTSSSYKSAYASSRSSYSKI